MMMQMNEPADLDDILAKIRAMPLEERHQLTAALLQDIEADFAEPPDVLAEMRKRAEAALEQPERGITLEESVAGARAVAKAERSRAR